MLEKYDVAVVGAGHGGAQTALALRAQNFRGTIALFGDEPDLPYDRPALSKEYLAGERPLQQLPFLAVDGWVAQGITLKLGQRIVAVDAARHQFETHAGVFVQYGRLVWATGSTPRALACPGHRAVGVHTLRSRSDVDRILEGLSQTQHVIVVGGGYIGLEAAAVLTKLGKQVTVLEALDRVLARVAGEPLSRFYEKEHRAHGVDVRLGARVGRIEEQGGRVCGVSLADGTTLPAQVVIVGIGVEPSVRLLRDQGAAGHNGVRVDAHCHTSLPDIYAIGDCAEHRNRYSRDEWTRLESVQNANDQALTAAKAICGRPQPYDVMPSFWSNQYDLRLQIAGLSRDFDDAVVRGDPATRSFSVIYRRNKKVIGLDCVNAVRDYLQGKALVTTGVATDAQLLADPEVPLKRILSDSAAGSHISR